MSLDKIKFFIPRLVKKVKQIILISILLYSKQVANTQQRVSFEQGVKGVSLLVDDTPIFLNGMNWDYFPIGTNYSYNLWNQSDKTIKKVLDAEMSLLRDLGINAIRVYTGIQVKWIEYIYDEYGIFTMLNHSFGRYGVEINGKMISNTDYNSKETADILLSEISILAKNYRNARGLILYLLGNENNYGLFWAGSETEDFPDSNKEKQRIGEIRGRPMYSLMNEASRLIKKTDPFHPVAICNGDVLFIDIIAEECPDVDIYGTNVYRGLSFGNLFKLIKEKLQIPVILTEFGADAYNTKSNKEDQYSQAYYNLENWKEIYENVSGLGRAGNCIGGFTFQFSDGWWKFKQDQFLNIHNINASWSNGGYKFDYEKGKNNMNEEWFGICAKEKTDEGQNYQLVPRSSYYALKEAHKFNPLIEGTSLEQLYSHFESIKIIDPNCKHNTMNLNNCIPNNCPHKY